MFPYTPHMGGEPASSVRRRLNGKVCCACGSSLPPPHVPGERCPRCLEANAPRKRIYMHFMLREGWFCQFLEEDLKTPLPKKLTLKDPAPGERSITAFLAGPTPNYL